MFYGDSAMRILILSDVHGNPWALDAVLQDAGPVDRVIFAGDAVNYGPEPQAVVARLRQEEVLGVCGNHDRAVSHGESPRASPSKHALAEALAAWTRAQLDPRSLEWLSNLPTTVRFTFAGTRFLVVHGTPQGHLYDYRLTPDATEALLGELLEGVEADLLIAGHTHLPLVRRYHAISIVNPGSVGQPLDGDPRAAYAVWQDGHVELRRVAYDQDALLHATATLPLAPPLLSELLDMVMHARLAAPPPKRSNP